MAILVKFWAKAPQHSWPWVTFIIFILLMAIYCSSEAVGAHGTLTQAFRLTPRGTHYFPYPRVSTPKSRPSRDQSHCLGPFRLSHRKNMGRIWCTGIVLFSAISTGWLLALVFENPWPAEKNIVGFSAVTFCVFITGSYAGLDWLRRTLISPTIFPSKWHTALPLADTAYRVASLLAITLLETGPKSPGWGGGFRQ